MDTKTSNKIKYNLKELNTELINLSSQEVLQWGFDKFGDNLAFTTSFGIQSSVLLHLIQSSSLKNKVKIFWIDTGYLPKETYLYADMLINQLSLDINILQSKISPAHMEAIHGRLWESNNVEDMNKYHQIRKIDPLEEALKKYSINCWVSGVRAQQTENRSKMKFIELIRNRLSLRPLLGWTQKEIFYYMQENKLPQHPLFTKGYSSVGDWHSSSAENENTKGRATRFGGVKQECGLHINDYQI
tara:strand:+ start:1510 stop:2241 length:732 start_codon:yes stop_codon:yes gene_type:complete